MNESEPFDRSHERAFSVALLRLNELIEAGRDEEAEGDAVRDEMDMQWYRMDDRQRERMDYLAVDLEHLAHATGKPDRVGPVDREWAKEMQSARGDASVEGAIRILALLRDPRAGRPSGNIAFIQARKYELLDMPEVALVFYEAAETRDASLKMMTLNFLVQQGRMDLALPRAETMIVERGQDPVAVHFACMALMQSVRHAELKIANPTIARIKNLLTPAVAAFEKSSPNDPNRLDIFPAAVMILGLCLDRLGEPGAAIKVYDKYFAKSARIYFADAEIYALRGSAKVAIAKDDAMADLRKSVELGTTSAWPYIYLVSDSLRNNNLKDVIALCNFALNFRPDIPDVCKALLHEGLAIALDRLGQPKQRVLEIFDRAIDLSPSDPRLQHNREIAAADASREVRESLTSNTVGYINQLRLTKFSVQQFVDRIANQASQSIEGVSLQSAA